MRFVPFAPAPRIAGFGVLTPAGPGADVLASARETDRPPAGEVTVDLASLCGPDCPAYRRADRYGALAIAAAREALAAAGVAPPPAADASWGVMLGSSLGCFASSARFHDELEHRPAMELSPALFARTAPSAAARDISLALHLGGASETFVSGWTAGIDALIAAGTAKAEGAAEWVLAGAIEAPGERYEPVQKAARRRAGFEWLPESLAEAAACVVLGPEESAGCLRLHSFWRGRDPEDRWSLGEALLALRPLAIPAVIVANSSPPELLASWRAEAAGRTLIDLARRAGELGSAGSIVACAVAGALGCESVLIIARGTEGDIGAIVLSR